MSNDQRVFDFVDVYSVVHRIVQRRYLRAAQRVQQQRRKFNNWLKLEQAKSSQLDLFPCAGMAQIPKNKRRKPRRGARVGHFLKFDFSEIRVQLRETNGALVTGELILNCWHALEILHGERDVNRLDAYDLVVWDGERFHTGRGLRVV